LFSVRFSAGLYVERTLSLPLLTCDFENFVSLADIMPFARAQGQVFAPSCGNKPERGRMFPTQVALARCVFASIIPAYDHRQERSVNHQHCAAGARPANLALALLHPPLNA
jgi:hypothetical protein